MGRVSVHHDVLVQVAHAGERGLHDGVRVVAVELERVAQHGMERTLVRKQQVQVEASHLRERFEDAAADRLPVFRRMEAFQLQPLRQQRVPRAGERGRERPRIAQRQHAEAEMARAVGRKIQASRLVEEEIYRHPALLVPRGFQNPTRLEISGRHT
jgi:hypothetical protein